MPELHAVILAFSAGLVSSVGPCVAPRYAAVTALASGVRSTTVAFRIAAFLLGTVIASTVIALGGALLVRLAAVSSLLYLAICVALVVAGIWTLLTADRPVCSHARLRSGYGGAFFLGAGLSLTVSPCCAPLLVALTGIASVADPSNVTALVGSFMAGHLTPLLPIAIGARALSGFFSVHRAAIATVNAAILLALGGYYGLLA